ncbi:hypothetical protein B0T26DRAFT_728846 [Lasiosphaeria miniovina]|uniref:F-box domain-containing protein n=1 Tax=Lasiosphaeria miniovina TaxID=1954250 RepID=A0AA40DP58_9PEZI|nr:uncharacterized protein B0T26DRAFT_728846 [Lasiosphaeria miniovina]KAK0707013.1 hypothetical protein B0T26DRAFT_728846 [Lasiosphaeria miniovina]
MDRTPDELMVMIASHLEAPLAPYAAISRRWQDVIEARTFSEIHLTSDEGSRLKFDAAFKTTRRRRMLQVLDFEVELPCPYFDKVQARREAAKNNAAFTEANLTLFQTLSVWDRDDTNVWFNLAIGVDLVGRSPRSTDMNTNTYIPPNPVNNWIKYVNFDYAILNASGGLPLVLVVSALKLSVSYRLYHPNLLTTLSGALPNLEGLDANFLAPARRLPNMRQSIRSSMAGSLCAIAANLHFLTCLKLYWGDCEPSSLRFPLESYIGLDSPHDRFSIAIRRICQLPTMRHVQLIGNCILSDQIFGGAADDSVWPSLKTIEIGMALTAPDARWYFTGNPEDVEPIEDYGDSEGEIPNGSSVDAEYPNAMVWAFESRWQRENSKNPFHNFRTKPCGAILVPFLTSLARATARMPALRQLELELSFVLFVGFYRPSLPKLERDYSATTMGSFFDAHRNHSKWVICFDDEAKKNWRFPPVLTTALLDMSPHIFRGQALYRS